MKPHVICPMAAIERQADAGLQRLHFDLKPDEQQT
jgi:hypothetical protein